MKPVAPLAVPANIEQPAVNIEVAICSEGKLHRDRSQLKLEAPQNMPLASFSKGRLHRDRSTLKLEAPENI